MFSVHLCIREFACVCLQSVGSGLSLEPPATTEADEEEDGMSDIIQEVTDSVNMISVSSC